MIEDPVSQTDLPAQARFFIFAIFLFRPYILHMTQDLTDANRQLAKDIVSQIGQQLRSCQFIAKGSTCVAFKLHTNKADLVLRVAAPRGGKSARFELDFSIRQALSRLTTYIATPVATNRDFQIEGVQTEWALDHYCEGDTLPRGQIPRQISQQLATVLAGLHQLPVKGYGKLKNARTEFLGCDPDPVSGLLSRFEQPWPFSKTPLPTHPSVQADPSLLRPLKAIEHDLRNFGTTGNRSIIHGDLHELQFLTQNGQLSALLDFNESFVGRREWDFGSYLYFHGNERLHDLLNAYGQDGSELEQMKYNAWLASILIALHHGNRSAILSRPSRLKASVRYLKEAVRQIHL